MATQDAATQDVATQDMATQDMATQDMATQDMATQDMGIGRLVCFAKGKPGDWEAICLTFDLAVQGVSEDEVQHSLRQAIALFLQSVKDEPDPIMRRQLLKRRAPLVVWLRHVSSFFLHVMFSRHRRSDGYSEAGFVMPCPA